MPTDFRHEEPGRRVNSRRDENPPRQQHKHGRDGDGARSRSGHRHGHRPLPGRMSRSKSPMLLLHHKRNKAELEARERGRSSFYDSYHRESQQRQSRERERRSPPVKSRIVPGPPLSRHLRMDEDRRRSTSHNPKENRDKERMHDGRNISLGSKRNPNSDFADLDRVVKRAREERDPSYWNKKVMEVEERDPNRWGHSGFKELYPNEKSGTLQKSRTEFSRRSRSRSPQRKSREEPSGRRSRSPRNPRRSRTPPVRRDLIGLKSSAGPRRPSPPARGNSHVTQSKNAALRSAQSKDVRSVRNTADPHSSKRRDEPPLKKKESQSRPVSEIGNRKQHLEKLSSGSSGGVQIHRKSNSKPTQHQPQKLSSRPNSGKDSKQGDLRQKERARNSSISEDEDSTRSRTPSPQLKRKADAKDLQRRTPVSTKSRSSSSTSSSDDDVLEIHARDRRQSLSHSSSDDDSVSDESVRKAKAKSPFASSPSDSSDEGSMERSRGNKTKLKKTAEMDSNQKKGTKSSGSVNAGEKSTRNDEQKKGSPARVPNNSSKAKGKGSDSGDGSDSGSESSSESEEEPRMTLSERFAKLTQMSRDKREFAKPEISINDIDTKLKVVKDLRNPETKVFVNQAKRPSSAKSRPKSPDFNEGEVRYPADDRRRHFERMTRDEPLDRDRPTDWSDVRVRFNYYKSRGYFDERPLTLEEYSKWEAWWYEYRDWLAEEGYYDQHIPPGKSHRGGANGNGRGENNWRLRDEQPPPLLNGPRTFHDRQRNFQPRPEPLLARPIRFEGGSERGPGSLMQPVPNRVPISRRIGHGTGVSLLVNIRPPMQQGGQGNFRGGRGRLAGRIGFRR